MSDGAPGLVRAAREDDLDGLRALEEDAFDEPWSRDLLSRCLELPHLLILVVEGREGLTASATLQRTADDEAELLRICSESAHRRRGHAARLLDVAIELLGQQGIRSLFLEVREGNAGARRLYEGFGFREVGQRPRYYSDGSTALVLRLDL